MRKKVDDSPFSEPTTDVPWKPDQPLPAFVSIGGIELVIVAKDAYLELAALRARYKNEQVTAAVRAGKAPPLGLSSIEKDAEVADFLRERFRGRETLTALHEACVAEFGKMRAPSIGRIQTFRSRFRDYR